jgi:hypothetical protein
VSDGVSKALYCVLGTNLLRDVLFWVEVRLHWRCLVLGLQPVEVGKGKGSGMSRRYVGYCRISANLECICVRRDQWHGVSPLLNP